MKPSEIVKFCPKCGSSKIQAKNYNAFFCEDCKFEFFVNVASAVGILIFNQKDEVLLSKRRFNPKKGFWDVPGGFVEPFEKAEIAGIREIKEELNLDIEEKNLKFICTFPNNYTYSNLDVPVLDIFFEIEISEKELEKIEASDDVEDFKFIKLEEMKIEEMAFESGKTVLEILKERRK
jgi:ADP-ribose pyrophosphatase YjhB (NUDIX family)